MRIYAIHTGSYSDQGWGPVFSTVEKAQAYLATHRLDEPSIEIYVLDDENDTGPVYPVWLVVFDKTGQVIHTMKEDDADLYEPLIHDKSVEVERVPAQNHWWFLDKVRHLNPEVVVRNVYAPDEQHAIKIAADKRFAFLAREAGMA